MTIKEYLENQLKLAENSESLSAKGKDIYGEGFAEGRKFAVKEMTTAFPRLEHELTIRELKEFCKAHECEDCPLARAVTNEQGNPNFYCSLLEPKYWDVDEIEETIREE